MRNTVRAAAVATLLVLPTLTLMAGAPEARAQDAGVTKAKAKEIVEASRDAVIHVKVALKLSMGGQDMDQQIEILGTVIDASGLTVLSEAGLNPTGMFGGEDSGMTTSVGDLKMVLKDGKEVPGRVVLRDKDLDLAFVVPNDKGTKFPFVSLDGGKAPDVLDDVVIVSRLRRSLDRTPSVALGRINAIVKKPRTFYVCEGAGAAVTGCPAFDGAGKPLGIFLQRRAAAVAGGGGLMDFISGIVPVILPCDDVKEGAQQAMVEAAKAPAEAPKPAADAKKSDEPKDEPKEAPKDEPKKDAPKTEEPKKEEPK